MIAPKDFTGRLLDQGLDFYAGVPDSLLKDLCAYWSDNLPEGRFTITANEGNAVGMACGWHLATGGFGVVFMQNSGEGNAVNPLLSIADPDVYSIPMMLVIGWRGEPGVHDEPQHVKQGKVTCGLLDAMDVPYEVLGQDGWHGQIERLAARMRDENRPVALVVRKGSFEPYAFHPDGDAGLALSREDALEAVLSEIGGGFVVSTTGKTSREVFELREARGEGHGKDFLTVGGMGHTASIAFGMALGTDKDVWCIDGDGSLLMHMGSLPVIAQNMPANFKYILNNNGAHESVGGQPTVARRIDVSGVLKSSGFDEVITASTLGEIAMGIRRLKEGRGCALVLETRQGARADLGRPTTTPAENKRAIMAELAK